MEQLILVAAEHGVVTLTLNQPEKMNALSQSMAEQLYIALHEAAYDDSTRAVVLRGAQGRFCAGGDIGSMKKRIDCYAQDILPESSLQANMWNLNRLVLSIRQIEKPVIAWIEGACAGGGLSLAMACDFSIAAEDTKMTCAFAGVGLAPDMGSTLMMLRRINPALATDLFMTARRFTGAQAAEWGLITQAVPTEQLEKKVAMLTEQLRNGPTKAYAEIKNAFNQILYERLYSCMVDETVRADRLTRTVDHAEAVNAFLEKRKPIFIGK